jgi:hypothetical protein
MLQPFWIHARQKRNVAATKNKKAPLHAAELYEIQQ